MGRVGELVGKVRTLLAVCAGQEDGLDFGDQDSMSVENEMRDIMRGEQQEHTHSMDDIVIPLLEDRRTQVRSAPSPTLPSPHPTMPYSE